MTALALPGVGRHAVLARFQTEAGVPGPKDLNAKGTKTRHLAFLPYSFRS